VLLNFSDTPRSVAITGCDWLATLDDATIVTDRLSGADITIANGSIPLAAWGARVLTPYQVMS
jgi:hypothetical protein